MEYLVTWSINVEADSAEEAAVQCLVIQRDAESTATVFTVQELPDGLPVPVDLADGVVEDASSIEADPMAAQRRGL
jgi:hypothetical protein